LGKIIGGLKNRREEIEDVLGVQERMCFLVSVLRYQSGCGEKDRVGRVSEHILVSCPPSGIYFELIMLSVVFKNHMATALNSSISCFQGHEGVFHV